MKHVWAMGMLMTVAAGGVAQAAEPPTFSDEVVRIVQERCQTCHRPGEHAPFSLITYADAYKHRAEIRDAVQWRSRRAWGKHSGNRARTTPGPASSCPRR